MTKDELFELVVVLTAKNMALEEEMEKVEESNTFQLEALQEQIDLYRRILKRHEEVTDPLDH